jgi:hypothetical protein
MGVGDRWVPMVVHRICTVLAASVVLVEDRIPVPVPREIAVRLAVGAGGLRSAEQSHAVSRIRIRSLHSFSFSWFQPYQQGSLPSR